MSHSVSRHLRLEIDSYDETIRRFIPGYQEMIDAAVEAVLEVEPLGRVIDLGAGTGALSERLLERHPTVSVELWDVDPEMLTRARERLDRFGARAVFVERSFDQPLGGADAAMASLALHHVLDLDDKKALYRSLAEGLRPGGRLANADATMPEDEAGRSAVYRGWADHMVAHGIAEEQSWRHFDEWSNEDRYFPLETERSALEEAGFRVECRYRHPPSTLLVATLDPAD